MTTLTITIPDYLAGVLTVLGLEIAILVGAALWITLRGDRS